MTKKEASLPFLAAAFSEVGGIPEIFDKYSKAVAEDEYQSFDANGQPCARPREDFGHFFRDAKTADIPWTGVFTGMIINSIWYWCTDQVRERCCCYRCRCCCCCSFCFCYYCCWQYNAPFFCNQY